MPPAKLRIGVLSFAHGHVGTYCGQIRSYIDAELTAAWDDDPERGEEATQRYGMTYTPHVEDVLQRPDIDAVIIGSETSKHADLAVAALEAGKAVLLQKPMALTLAQCDRIIETVDRTGQWFSMAFQMRHDPMNQRMRDLVLSGALGRIGTVRRRHCIGVLFNKDFLEGKTRWHIRAEDNRGMFFDDAIHAFDWLLWTMGEAPVSVMAEIDNVLTDVAPDDTGVAIFRFADGAFAEVYNASVTLAGENTTEIYGDKGVLIQNHGDAVSTSLRPPGAIGLKMYRADQADRGWQDLGARIPESQGERIAGVARPFIDALRAGVPLCTAREGRQSVEMALAAYQSAREGRRVSLPLAGDPA